MNTSAQQVAVHWLVTVKIIIVSPGSGFHQVSSLFSCIETPSQKSQRGLVTLRHRHVCFLRRPLSIATWTTGRLVARASRHHLSSELVPRACSALTPATLIPSTDDRPETRAARHLTGSGVIVSSRLRNAGNERDKMSDAWTDGKAHARGYNGE